MTDHKATLKTLCGKAYQVRDLVMAAEKAGEDVADAWAAMQDADDLIDDLIEQGEAWEAPTRYTAESILNNLEAAFAR